MGQSKHERLYGMGQQKKDHKKVGSPMTPGQNQKVAEEIPVWVEGGFINDASGKASEDFRRRGFRGRK